MGPNRKTVLNFQRTGNSHFHKLFQDIYFLKGMGQWSSLTQACEQVQYTDQQH